jgi:hypothetical protein
MSIIAPVMPVEINQIPDITTFSTSGASSVGSLDEAMSSLIAKDAQRKNAVTAATKAIGDGTDPIAALKAQALAGEFFEARNLGSSILAKFKTTFDKVVLNSQ